MNLTADLVDQFVDATKDEEKKSSDGIVYGTVVKNDNATYVQLDGSSTATPVSTTMNVKHGDRVTVLIKNHTATITGNYSYPADSTTSTMTSINSFNMAVGNKVTVETLTANEAFIKFLLSDKITAETIIAAEAEINKLEVDELTVENLKAIYGEFEELDAYFADLGVVTIDKATIQDLNAVSGQFRELNVDFAKFEELVATKATVGDLFAKNVEAEIINSTAVNAKFANVEFGNIGEAAIRKLFANTGLIDNLTVGDNLKVTGELAAVTINASSIKSGQMTADRLMLKGEDGIYYQLNLNALGEAFVTDLTEEEQQELQNGIHGENIIANSITAKHISVDDLTAFGARIAGFTITSKVSNSNVVPQFASGMEVTEGKYYRKCTYLCHIDGNPNSLDDVIYFQEVIVGDDVAVEVFTRGMSVVPGTYYIDDTDVYLCIQDGTPSSIDDETYFYKETCIGAIYSGVKSSVDNTTRGVYLDDIGQFAVGDTNSFLKFYKASDGTYKLAIKASEIVLAGSGKSVEDEVGKAVVSVDIKYALSDSPTIAPTDGWSGSIAAEKVDAKYVWQRTTTTYANGKTDVSVVCIQGSTGKDGTGVESITTEYCVTSSKDAPPNGYKNGEYGLAVIQNDDGTQTLAITDAAGSYDISLLQGANGSKILSIANAEDGGSYDISLIEGETGAKILSVENAAGESQGYNISLLQGDNGAKILSIVTAAGGFDIVVTDNNDGTQTLEISDAEGWSEEPPAWSPGKYVWTRHKIVYKNPTSIAYTTPVCDSSWEAVNKLEAESKEHVHDQISSVNKKLTDDKTSLESMIERNATKINSLDSLVETIRGKLQRIVTDEDEKKMTMFEQSEDSYIFNFFEKQQTQTDAINAYQGAVVIGKDEVTGDPNITIQSAAEASIKLKLNNNDISFLDKSNKEIGVISADTEGRLGIAVDNETVTGELRQSNASVPDGEFVWQVRRNGNYGLSWKEKVKV